MKKISLFIPISCASLIVLSACAGASTPQSVPTSAKPNTPQTAPTSATMAKTDAMTDTKMADTKMMSDTKMMAGSAMTDTKMAAHDAMTDAKMMAGNIKLSALQTLPLTDVQTGKVFKLSDYLGKVVYVEPMATWCPNCRAQLAQVTAAKKQLAGSNVVFVALSVENTLDPAKLAQYAKDTGYDLQFAVLNVDGLKALSEVFGQSALNPPSTPHFIIKPDGAMTDLRTGSESAAELVARLKAIQ